jgi:hypothetical protein
MVKKKPLSGIGLDSYGDYYLQVRSNNAAFHSPQTQSNAAHNVFLDLASNGGLPLIFAYLSILVFGFYRCFKYLKQQNSFDPYYGSLFAAWVGILAQSIVSINQIGLAIWGWIIPGVLIGMSYKSESTQSPSVDKRGLRSRNKNNSLVMGVLGFSIGCILVTPQFLADHNYRIASQSGNANLMIKSATQYPRDAGRTLNAAQVLANSRLMPQALELAKLVVKENPRNYNGWLFISQITQPNTVIHKKALSMVQILNPKDKSLRS